eukprot:m51a1_g349 hypothetical protein, unlikely (828) ;mRNA; r:547474-552202
MWLHALLCLSAVARVHSRVVSVSCGADGAPWFVSHAAGALAALCVAGGGPPGLSVSLSPTGCPSVAPTPCTALLSGGGTTSADLVVSPLGTVSTSASSLDVASLSPSDAAAAAVSVALSHGSAYGKRFAFLVALVSPSPSSAVPLRRQLAVSLGMPLAGSAAVAAADCAGAGAALSSAFAAACGPDVPESAPHVVVLSGYADPAATACVVRSVHAVFPSSSFVLADGDLAASLAALDTGSNSTWTAAAQSYPLAAAEGWLAARVAMLAAASLPNSTSLSDWAASSTTLDNQVELGVGQSSCNEALQQVFLTRVNSTTSSYENLGAFTTTYNTTCGAMPPVVRSEDNLDSTWHRKVVPKSKMTRIKRAEVVVILFISLSTIVLSVTIFFQTRRTASDAIADTAREYVEQVFAFVASIVSSYHRVPALMAVQGALSVQTLGTSPNDMAAWAALFRAQMALQPYDVLSSLSYVTRNGTVCGVVYSKRSYEMMATLPNGSLSVWDMNSLGDPVGLKIAFVVPSWRNGTLDLAFCAQFDIERVESLLTSIELSHSSRVFLTFIDGTLLAASSQKSNITMIDAVDDPDPTISCVARAWNLSELTAEPVLRSFQCRDGTTISASATLSDPFGYSLAVFASSPLSDFIADMERKNNVSLLIGVGLLVFFLAAIVGALAAYSRLVRASLGKKASEGAVEGRVESRLENVVMSLRAVLALHDDSATVAAINEAIDTLVHHGHRLHVPDFTRDPNCADNQISEWMHCELSVSQAPRFAFVRIFDFEILLDAESQSSEDPLLKLSIITFEVLQEGALLQLCPFNQQSLRYGNALYFSGH